MSDSSRKTAPRRRLPRTPLGRLCAIRMLAESGAISTDQVRALFGLPPITVVMRDPFFAVEEWP